MRVAVRPSDYCQSPTISSTCLTSQVLLFASITCFFASCVCSFSAHGLLCILRSDVIERLFHFVPLMPGLAISSFLTDINTNLQQPTAVSRLAAVMPGSAPP